MTTEPENVSIAAKAVGGPMARRTLDFVYLLDSSASMEGQRIGALDYAIKEGSYLIDGAAGTNPEVDVRMRAIAFASGAWWHIAQPQSVRDFVGQWQPLTAAGITDLGEALTLLADDFAARPADQRGFAPVITLITDGRPTDDWQGGLNALLETPWGEKSIRQAIIVGDDTDRSMIDQFVSNPDHGVIELKNDPSKLTSAIKWASTWFEDIGRVSLISDSAFSKRETGAVRTTKARNRRLEAAVIDAKCPVHRKRIGLRGEVDTTGRWVFTWAIELADSDVGATLPSAVNVSPATSIDKGFACPLCRANGFVRCSKCRKFSCWTKSATIATCGWCGHSDVVTRLDGGSNSVGRDS